MKKISTLIVLVGLMGAPIFADAALETFRCDLTELRGHQTESLSADLSLVEDEGPDDVVFPKITGHLEGHSRSDEENDGMDIKLYLFHEDEEILGINFFVPYSLDEDRDYLDMELTKYNVSIKCYAY